MRRWLCAVDIDGPGIVAEDADEPVVAASVYKVLVALQFFAGGQADVVRLRPADRTPGPTGLSLFADDVEMSLRDLATMMLVVSDNTAADVLLERVGRATLNEAARALGLTGTVVVSSLRDLLDSIGRELGFDGWASLQLTPHVVGRIPSIAALQPATATRTTARDMATLLRLIWRDEAGPPEACAQVRRLMAAQVTRHRLASGFGDDVQVSAKSGSLLGVVRNEVGVVEYPDGGRYAVAVFTRADEPYVGEARVNAVIGTSASEAVVRLRHRAR